jgi:hypothetical protein
MGVFISREVDVETKRCTKCGIVKSVTEFNRNRNHRDGYHSACKVCKRAADAKCRETYAEELRERNRAWKTKKRQDEEWMARRREMLSIYSPDPVKARARHRVHMAIKRGDLPHPSSLSCTVRSVVCSGQAQECHHLDYTKPLYVVAVCVECHDLIHKDKVAS